MAKRIKGKVVTWNDDKGYGFISPLLGGDRVFVHIKAFNSRRRRPVVGDVVTYAPASDKRGRPCAQDATIAGVAAPAASKRSSTIGYDTLTIAFLLFVGAAIVLSAAPWPVLPYYLIVSLVTFAAYALDKSAAKRGAWRTKESALHMLALVGGWPGALLAQTRLRHKTIKQPFRAIFWFTVILNCAAFFWSLTPSGKRMVQAVVSLTG